MKAKIFFPVLILTLLITPGFESSTALAQEAGPGEGLVIFSREDKLKGKAIRFNVKIDGSSDFQLPAGTTIQKALPVGSHTFTVSSPSVDGQDFLTIDVQEGWTYHIEGSVLWGWPAGRAKFKLVSESGPAPGSLPARSNANVLAGAALGAAATPSGPASPPPFWPPLSSPHAASAPQRSTAARTNLVIRIIYLASRRATSPQTGGEGKSRAAIVEGGPM